MVLFLQGIYGRRRGFCALVWLLLGGCTAVPLEVPESSAASVTVPLDPPLRRETPTEWPTRWDARWRAVGDEDQCRLELEVPGYGRAAFLTLRSASNPEALAFELLASRDLMAPAPVNWRRRAPSWHPRFPDSGRWQPLQGVQGFGARIAMPMAERMALDLYSGYELDLGSVAMGLVQPELYLRLAALGFRPAFDAFRLCQGESLPRSLEALKRTRVGFASASHRLTGADQRRLAELARYILADGTIDRVFVDGHTDAVGKEADNLTLSKRRAEAVREVLVAAGVSPSLLILRYHGERYPVERRGAQQSSAVNRRATVRIETSEALTRVP